ncbi:MAG: hypothetical protein AAF989_07750 [Planctomycetota bacterium]
MDSVARLAFNLDNGFLPNHPFKTESTLDSLAREFPEPSRLLQIKGLIVIGSTSFIRHADIFEKQRGGQRASERVVS